MLWMWGCCDAGMLGCWDAGVPGALKENRFGQHQSEGGLKDEGEKPGRRRPKTSTSSASDT